MQVSVIGLGKLGSPLAAVSARKGHQVVGLDVNPDYVRALAAGRAPVEEPGLQPLFDGSRARPTATSDYEQAVLASELSAMIVPTPTDIQGRLSQRRVAYTA